MSRERFLEIVRFCLVGGLSLLVDCAILFALTDFAGVHYLYSAAVSFTASVIFNYWLCVKYVFRNARRQTPHFEQNIFALTTLGAIFFALAVFVERNRNFAATSVNR